jgi:hypothetical protein
MAVAAWIHCKSINRYQPSETVGFVTESVTGTWVGERVLEGVGKPH